MTMVLSGILSFVIDTITLFISIILSPIDNIIRELLPDFDIGLNYINSFFEYINQYARFIMTWVHIPRFALDLLSGLIIFFIVVRPIMFTIKTILKWYKTFKP